MDGERHEGDDEMTDERRIAEIEAVEEALLWSDRHGEETNGIISWPMKTLAQEVRRLRGVDSWKEDEVRRLLKLSSECAKEGHAWKERALVAEARIRQLEKVQEAGKNMLAAFDRADDSGIFSDHGEHDADLEACPGCALDVTSEALRASLGPEKP